MQFIIANSKPITIGETSPSYGDPFTGGNRYVPGGLLILTSEYSSLLGGQQSATRGDPFTGGNRYVPQSTQQFAEVKKCD